MPQRVIYRVVHTVAETAVFQRRAAALLSTEEKDELIGFLAANPEAGVPIPGTSGVRKLRFAAQGRGKSGGVRVIHYFYDETLPVFALLIYGKNEQVNPTPEQKRAVRAFAEAVKATRKR